MDLTADDGEGAEDGMKSPKSWISRGATGDTGATRQIQKRSRVSDTQKSVCRSLWWMQFHRSFRCPEYRALPVFTLKQQYRQYLSRVVSRSSDPFKDKTRDGCSGLMQLHWDNLFFLPCLGQVEPKLNQAGQGRNWNDQSSIIASCILLKQQGRVQPLQPGISREHFFRFQYFPSRNPSCCTVLMFV